MIARRTALLGAAALVGGLLYTAYARQTPPPTTNRTPLDAHRTLGTPQTYRNLTLIPVYDSTARASNTYITLDEALKTRQVTVKEAKDGGEVNTLFVTNKGTKPLYLMAGEVVLGGQQDRTLARDTIIPPGKKEVAVTVFCVEHGRWTGHKEFADSAKSVASASIRADAYDGAYAAERANSGPAGPAGPGGQTSINGVAGRPSQQAAARTRELPDQAINANAGRVQTRGGNVAADAAPVSVAQQKVWDKVAAKNSKLKVQNSTGTYRDTLNMAKGDAQSAVPAYVNALNGKLDKDPQVVGVVAAVNGKVIAADIFGDPTLFRKLLPKLLRSYAADAVEDQPAKNQKVTTITSGEAKDFLVQASDAKSKTENRSDVSSTLRYESKEALTFRLVPGAMGGGVGGGTAGGGVAGGKPVHESVLRK